MSGRKSGEKGLVRDERGRFGKGNRLAPGPGRPKGQKDTRPRRGSIKAVYLELIEAGQGHEKMLKAVNAGIQADPKTALGYLELGAKVLDKTEEVQGKFVHFHLYTNVDFTKLDDLARKNGMMPPLALPAVAE